MKIQGVICSDCGEFIWSRFRHDMRYCSCGKTFVDGGKEYLRFGWTGAQPPKEETREMVEND